MSCHRSIIRCVSGTTRSSSSSSVMKPSMASYLYNPIKKYSKQRGEENGGQIMKERAPSTAEVMKELNQEKQEKERKLKQKEHQGFVSHTSDKVVDAATTAIGGDTDPDTIKEKYKEAAPGDSYHKLPPDDDTRTS